MRRKQIWLTLILFYFFTGCVAPVSKVVLQPTARDILSPDELPASLINEQIYWQGRPIYLSGEPVVNDPVSQLLDEMRVVSGPIPKISLQKRYLAYKDFLSTKILLWDLETNERRWLAEAGKDLPSGAWISDIAFMPDDKKIIFSYVLRSENQRTYSDLALVNIETGDVELLNIVGFQADFFEIDVSPNGKWVATNMVTLDDRVCLLVNLETRRVECLNGEKGWYSSGMFLPDSKHVVYSHFKEIRYPSSIILSKIDSTESQELVSGLAGGGILIVSFSEIVFVGGTYDNPAYSYIYVINQDGSDLRRLVYLGGERVSNDGPVVP